MSGALSRAFGSRMPPTSRRGWAGGGGVDDPQDDDTWMPDRVSDIRDGRPALPSILESNDQSIPGPAPVGAMSRRSIPMPAPVPPLEQGISEGVQPTEQVRPQAALNTVQDAEAQKAATIQRATQAILGGSGRDNLPLLMMAAGLLKPTNTGGFGESLGNAFAAAVPVAEQERKLQEEIELRKQTAAATALYRQQMADTASRRADSYAERSQAMSARDMAQAAKISAAAALRGASHATEGDILNATVLSLIAPDPQTGQPPVNPDTGKPFTRVEAYRLAKGVDIKERAADTADRRVDLAEDTNAWKQANAAERMQIAWQRANQTGEHQRITRDLMQKGRDQAQVNAVMGEALRAQAADPTGFKKPLQVFVDGVTRQRAALAPQPAPPPAEAPAGNAAPQTAINRQTGERLELRNGKWEPIP